MLHRLAEVIGPCKLDQIMQIRKVTGIDWCERRLISTLYMDQSVETNLD
jgi:hypothetical protein